MTSDREAAAAAALEELARLKAQVEERLEHGDPPRWNLDPEDARRAVAQLVLALIEFIRRILERQAIRRMDEGHLSPQEIERIGLALMRLEETIKELAQHFDLAPEELNLDLGPFGRLL